MNTYYIKLMGNDIVYIDEGVAENIAADIQAGKNITYKGRYIPNHQITDAGFLKPMRERLESDFEKATKLIGDRKPDPARRAESKAKIREILLEVDPREVQKREYLAAVAEHKRIKAEGCSIPT